MSNHTTLLNRDRHLRMLLGSFSVSMLGSRVTTIAYPMLVLRLTRSPVTAGWVACAVLIPSMLVYVPAGVLVDRWRPRRALVISEFLRGAAIVTVIVVVALFRARSVPFLIAPAIIEEALGAFSTLAERRCVRLLVEDDSLTPAMVGSEARTHVVVLLARPLGGLLFELHYLLPFIINLATFAFSVLCLFYMRFRELKLRVPGQEASQASAITRPKLREISRVSTGPPSYEEEISLVKEARAAWKWIRNDDFARVAIPLSSSSSLVAQALIIMFLAQANSRHMSPFTLGIVLAASGAGGTIGSMLNFKIPARLGWSWIQSLMMIWSATLLLLVFDSGSSLVTAVVMGIFGLTGALGNIELNEYLMGQVEDTMLARIISFRQLCTFAACAIGPTVGGFLAGWRSAPRSMWLLFWLTFSIALFSCFAFGWGSDGRSDGQRFFLDALPGEPMNKRALWGGNLATQLAIRASGSTSWRLKAVSSGQGNPGSAVRNVTAPCSATHNPVASVNASELADAPAATHA
jgi:MFS family permease